VSDERARDLRRLPKAHLHLHLEGAMRPATLIELAERYGVPVALDGDGSFENFIRLYRAACEALRTPDDMRRLVREIVEDAAADGAVWVEPAELLTATQAARLGLPHLEAVLEVVLDAARRAAGEVGIGVGVMLSSNRTRPPAEAVELARLAAEYAGAGVVAFGLADDETRGAPELFAEAFAIARSAGLISAPHAGEHAGPRSVLGAVEILGARRVAHGVRSAEDPRLLDRLADEAITLDVCPTSNVHLRVVPSLSEHPLPRLLEAGVPVSLNADDPLFFGSGLLAEYELARHSFGLDDAGLAHIARCSIRASGAPESLKASALAGIDAWLSDSPPTAGAP
jgi:adenosine deaminase